MITLAAAAHRRPYYFQRQLDGWLRCRGIEHVGGFFISLGASDREGDQLELIRTFMCAAPFKVEVIIDRPPIGPDKAFGQVLSRAFGTADFVFVTDEDILPADDTLELVTWAAAEFAGDDRVLSVNAHCEGGQGWDGPYVKDDPYADPAIVRLKPYHNQWGWGTWADRWEKILEPEWDWDGRHRGFDWNIQRVITERGVVAVTPDASRTQHIGYRDGMYSNAATLAFSEAASFREHRPPVQFRVEA